MCRNRAVSLTPVYIESQGGLKALRAGRADQGGGAMGQACADEVGCQYRERCGDTSPFIGGQGGSRYNEQEEAVR
jgi:hypothetical protein